MKPAYTEEDFKKEFFSLVEKQKAEFYVFESVCPWCKAPSPMGLSYRTRTNQGSTCASCGAPQPGYNPSGTDIQKMKVRAHIMANIKKGNR